MEWLPMCEKLENDVGERNWLDMMIVECREFADEHRDFALRVKRLIGDIREVWEDRIAFVQELRSVAGETVPAKTAVFLEDDEQRGALRDAVGGWDWVAMMVLYCRSSAAEDRDFARRMNELLQEMVAAYDDKVDFIRELEAVPGVDAAAKTVKFLNENL
ncbi:hypothetical protein Tco_0597885 [Tanacetum coccineum]